MDDEGAETEDPVGLHDAGTPHRHVNLPLIPAQDQTPDNSRYTHYEEGEPRPNVDNGNHELDGEHDQITLENQFVVDRVKAESLLPYPLLVLNDHALDDVRSRVNFLLIKSATKAQRTTRGRRRWLLIFIIDQIVHPLINLPSIHFY